MIAIRHYIHIGRSACCQTLKTSSDVLSNDMKRTAMAMYHYYGTDPDGGRIYYSSQNKLFLSRDHVMKHWGVS